MALSPEAEAIIKRREQEKLERIQGTRPMYDTGWTLGDHRLAVPGCEAWSNPERRGRAAGEDSEPMGGIIIEITTAPKIDTETGEVTQVRAYRCYDYTEGIPPHRRICTLTESEVAGFDAMDIARVRRAARRLAHTTKTRGLMSAFEANQMQDAARLAAIVAGTL